MNKLRQDGGVKWHLAFEFPTVQLSKELRRGGELLVIQSLYDQIDIYVYTDCVIGAVSERVQWNEDMSGILVQCADWR